MLFVVLALSAKHCAAALLQLNHVAEHPVVFQNERWEQTPANNKNILISTRFSHAGDKT